MYYGLYYGAILAGEVVVTPPTTDADTTPIAVPSVTNEPAPVDHVSDAIARLMEQYKP